MWPLRLCARDADLGQAPGQLLPQLPDELLGEAQALLEVGLLLVGMRELGAEATKLALEALALRLGRPA